MNQLNIFKSYDDFENMKGVAKKNEPVMPL